MTFTEFFHTLHSATTLADAENALLNFLTQVPESKWVPLGGRENNRGTVEASSDPGRSLIERMTNGIDGVLEYEHDIHNGVPDCRSPKEAATSWLNVPAAGLSEMTTLERRTLAQRVAVKLMAGEGRGSRTVEVRDYGIGLTTEQMPGTILSLNESNKMQKHYLAGAYGQGGSSTFASSVLTLIASRPHDEGNVAFTVIRYEDLPADLFKTGRYVYLTVEGAVLEAEDTEGQFVAGTLTKHFGYDLTGYPSPLGPNSVYGLINATLFDPVLPVWLDTSDVHQYRRVMKGSRNALNGAVDEGDDESTGSRKLSHNVKMFYTTLGEFGRIGIEYWLLERPSKANKKPSAAFVNPAKPIILTVNGQAQDEFTQTLIRKQAELPYLTQRLIVHIDCNHLTAPAKRLLFVSNRETGRHGIVRDLIQQEILKVLKSDDELTRLNAVARDQGREEQDVEAIKRMQSEVAKLLSLQGVSAVIGNAGQSDGASDGPDRPVRPPRPRPVPIPIELAEPPTYIKILWEEDEPIGFYPAQRRYLRIETNAMGSYHQADSPETSRINVIVDGDGMRHRGSTNLSGGRMRIIMESEASAALQTTGKIRIEMSRTGLATLADERPFEIVELPPTKPSKSNVNFPPFDVIAVEHNDERWNDLGWPDSIEEIASSANMEEGTLMVYYSTAFPKFADQFAALERKETAMAESFRKRYEIWLAVHSLLYHQDMRDKSDDAQENDITESKMDSDEKTEKEERVRIAMLSSLFAAREVQYSRDQSADTE